MQRYKIKSLVKIPIITFCFHYNRLCSCRTVSKLLLLKDVYVAGLMPNMQTIPLGALRHVRPILKKYNEGPRSAILNKHVPRKWQQLAVGGGGEELVRLANTPNDIIIRK
jgi:hypothetical protein